MKVICTKWNFRRWKRYGFLHPVQGSGWWILDLSERKRATKKEHANLIFTDADFNFIASYIWTSDGDGDVWKPMEPKKEVTCWYIQKGIWILTSYDSLAELKRDNMATFL